MRSAFLHLILSLLCTVAVLPVRATEERSFTVYNATNGLADNSAQAVVCTFTGRMIICTLGNLNFYNGASFSHIVTRREYQYPLPLYRGGYRLYFDRRHHLWTKSAGTMTCTNLTMEQFTLNTDSVLRSLECRMPVLDLFTDTLGNIWALHDQGLYGVEQRKTYSVLRDRNLQDVAVCDGMLITFYDNGEEMGQDLNTGNTVHRTRAYDWDTAQRYAATSAILPCGDGFLQLRNGDKEAILLFFDVKRKQWQTLMERPFHMNSMAMKGGKLYIATEMGYCIYNMSTKEQEWVEEITLDNGEHIHVNCLTLAFDRQGGFWLGTKLRGLLYSKPTETPFKAIDLDTPEARPYVEAMEGLEQNITEFQGLNANCLYTDSRGWSWIGTTTGLYMYKDPHQEPKVFTRRSGLYNDVIHSVVEDASHNIWVATSAGISFIGFDGEEVTYVNSFNEHDHIPAETFINNKARLLPDSQIVMQTIDHVVVFRPESTDTLNTPHPYQLYPKLTRLMVNGTTAEPNKPLEGNIVIDRAISRATTINLKSDQTTLSMLFSALNYHRPLQTYYHVRVRGLGNEEWHTYSYYNSDLVDGQGMLHLPLFGLEPGKYTVEVMASMFPGMWVGKPAQWEVVVNQSWWQAKGMYYGYGVILLMLAIANITVYIRNTRMRVKRNHEEGDIIGKISMFVERADTMDTEMLSPQPEELSAEAEKRLDPTFMDVMKKIMPFVRETRKEEITMRKLGEMADIDIVKLYELVTANIYKSPRDLIKQTRLKKAAEMLLNTDKSIEQISNECGFYTPNYFLGNFFHEHKQTPREYREERR